MATRAEAVSGVYLKVDGRPVSENVTNNITFIEVDDSLSLPDMFTVLLRDPGGEWLDTDAFAIGKAVDVYAAVGAGNATLISGEVTGIEPRFNSVGGISILLRGYDRSHRLNRDKKSRSFVQMSDSDIATKIAKEASLKTNVDSTRQVHDHLLQENQTDWDFLTKRAHRIGYRLFVEGDRLHFIRAPAAGGQTPVLEWGNDLLDFDARMSAALQVSEVVVQGWDPSNQQQILGRATAPRDTPQIGQRVQGGQAARQAFGITAKRIIVDRPVSTQAEADALAQSVCDEIGHGFIEAQCICSGNPSVQAGALVEIRGVGRRFSGTYRVTRAIHRHDASGYSTEFYVGGAHTSTLLEVLTPPSVGATNHSPIIGVVTNNDDPNRLGRVKVKFPTLTNSHESTWARLVLPGVGQDRGFVWIPDVGDEVVVVFEHGDVNRPLVMGNLWSQRAPPSDPSNLIASGKGSTVRIETHEKMGLLFMDKPDDTSIKLGDQDNHLAISKTNRQATLKSSGDVEIAATGKMEATAQAMEINSGTKIDVKGGVKVTLEAPLIDLVQGAAHPVVFGDQLLQYLTQLVIAYQTHMHPGEMAGPVPVTPAPPVPPLPPPTPTLLSLRVKSG